MPWLFLRAWCVVGPGFVLVVGGGGGSSLRRRVGAVGVAERVQQKSFKHAVPSLSFLLLNIIR